MKKSANRANKNLKQKCFRFAKQKSPQDSVEYRRVVQEGCGEFMRKSRDAVRYSLTLFCMDRQLIRTVTKNNHEIQTFSEDDWTKIIPPMGIFLTLYVNLWTGNRTRTCSCSAVIFLLITFGKIWLKPISYLLVVHIRSSPRLTKFCLPITSQNTTTVQRIGLISESQSLHMWWITEATASKTDLLEENWVIHWRTRAFKHRWAVSFQDQKASRWWGETTSLLDIGIWAIVMGLQQSRSEYKLIVSLSIGLNTPVRATAPWSLRLLRDYSLWDAIRPLETNDVSKGQQISKIVLAVFLKIRTVFDQKFKRETFRCMWKGYLDWFCCVNNCMGKVGFDLFAWKNGKLNRGIP